MEDNDLVVFKILCEEFNKYLTNVKKVSMESYQESIGTAHELATRTAANCVTAISNRWEAAYKNAIGGTEFDFPENISITKEQPKEPSLDMPEMETDENSHVPDGYGQMPE